MKVFKLTLVRHGETTHNRLRLIQGQLQTQLNDMGRQQAKLLAKYFDKYGVWFDQVYTSDLIRASETCLSIVQCRYDANSIYYSPLLRERSYGSLEGLPKDMARARANDLTDPLNQAQAKSPSPAPAPTAATTTTTSATSTTSPPNASASGGGGGANGADLDEDWGGMKPPSPTAWLERRVSGDGETLDDIQERVRQFCEEGLFDRVQNGQRVLVVSHGGTIREFMRLFRDKYRAQIGHADMVITPNTAINDFDILLSPPYNDVKYILPVNLHQIPHMIFDVYNRDNPNPALNFNMTTLEQFGFMVSQYESDRQSESATTSSQPSWGSQ